MGGGGEGGKGWEVKGLSFKTPFKIEFWPLVIGGQLVLEFEFDYMIFLQWKLLFLVYILFSEFSINILPEVLNYVV